MVIRKHLKWHTDQVGLEGAGSPHHGQANLLGGAVVILGLGEGAAGTAGESLLSVLPLSENSADTLFSGIGA